MGFRWAWARLLVGFGIGPICLLDLGLAHLLVGLGLEPTWHSGLGPICLLGSSPGPLGLIRSDPKIPPRPRELGSELTQNPHPIPATLSIRCTPHNSLPHPASRPCTLTYLIQFAHLPHIARRVSPFHLRQVSICLTRDPPDPVCLTCGPEPSQEERRFIVHARASSRSSFARASCRSNLQPPTLLPPQPPTAVVPLASSLVAESHK
uniref:Uncharacterized protein n=1 Tax=Cucumis melo TaxID=3656 RepID=A0A9I9EJK8_CUCME